MNLKIYKLHFTTPLHLSNESEDYAHSLRTLHSDTLYAALTSALAKVGYNFGEEFDGDLGFTISSLFPFYQKDKPKEGEKAEATYFFPKSRKIDILPEEMLELHKKIKKVKWFDIDSFKKHIEGDKIHDFFKQDNLFGSYYSNTKIPEDFITSQVFPHAQVPRQLIINGKEQDTKIYYVERLFFKDYSGMFFIADGKTDLLEKALNILQYEGIGTDRNVGNGFFEFSKDEITINLPESEYSMNLSIFLPENQEQLQKMLDDNSAYSFKKRGGWVTTPPFNTIRKNRIHLFEEGSVFKTNNEIKGRIADLTPDLSELATEQQLNHKIFRNGKSIFIPIKL